ADALSAMGVNVIGDLTNLLPSNPGVDSYGAAPTTVPMDLAVDAIVGTAMAAVEASREAEALAREAEERANEAVAQRAKLGPGINELTAKELAAVLRERLKAGVKRRLKR